MPGKAIPCQESTIPAQDPPSLKLEIRGLVVMANHKRSYDTLAGQAKHNFYVRIYKTLL